MKTENARLSSSLEEYQLAYKQQKTLRENLETQREETYDKLEANQKKINDLEDEIDALKKDKSKEDDSNNNS